jgi:hypothetical protein
MLHQAAPFSSHTSTIRTFLRQSISNYVDIERAVGSLEDYITPPGLGALAGPLGALAVGADAAARCRGESISMPRRP